MEISNRQYARALFEALKDLKESEMEASIRTFVEILASHNKLSQINRILADFVDFWSKEREIIKAEIVSAKVLSKDVLLALNEYIEAASGAKQVEIDTRVDESLVGGLILRRDDKIIDMSLKRRLRDIRDILRN